MKDMTKLVLSVDGQFLKEIPITKERTTIGRKAHNDIQIDNLAISGEHAVIITLVNDSFLEDRDSTNGTYVNGRPVKKHFLLNDDVIELGKYRLKYVAEPLHLPETGDIEKTTVLRRESVRAALAPAAPAAAPAPLAAPIAPVSAQSSIQTPVAMIQVLNGNSAGKEVELIKTLTTLGKPGVMVAAIARRPQGYFITHLEGAKAAMVGGRPLDAHTPQLLKDHDIIDLGGIKMEFFLKA
jgi:pSer/pThr/pTyr-binding forkhead associated (FHA) protein